MSETPEPGHLLLQLLQLLGWDVTVARGERVCVAASGQHEGLLVEAAGRTLADASFGAFERASRALVQGRGSTLAVAA